jgi:putative FmdB family regulatory protein
MPLYEYTCLNEKEPHTFEKLVKMADGNLTQNCPTCGSVATKIVSANSRQAEQWAETSYTPSPTAKSMAKKMTQGR